MDNVLETIHVALTGVTSLLSKISIGNTRLVPVIMKIKEAHTLMLHNIYRWLSSIQLSLINYSSIMTLYTLFV